MSESVVADFVAEALYDDRSDNEPVQCRVLLSRERLVVASDSRRTTVALSDIYDVGVSQVPTHLAEFLDQTVLVAYREDDELRRVIVNGEHDTIEKFASFLYKATLQGTRVSIRHPTMLGGRIRDADEREAQLQIERSTLRLRGPATDLAIDLDAVVGVVERERTVDGSRAEIVEVQYVDDGTVHTIELRHGSRREQNILRRYLRRRYFGDEERVEDYDPAEVEVEILTALYVGLDQAEIVDLIGMDPTDVGTILRALRDEELVADPENCELASAGRVAVVRRYRAAAE